MSEIRIVLDPCNPGQFYACCGLAELLGCMGDAPLTRFAVDGRRPRRAEFIVTGEGPLEVDALLGGLRNATCKAAADFDEAQKAIAPVTLAVGDARFELDWWLDTFREKAVSLKCWAGQQTSVGILSELLRLFPSEAGTDLFMKPTMASTRFGVDPRSAWSAVDFGYSPNEHQQEAATFAAVELLAAIGLQGFRPNGSRQGGFEYTLWATDLPLSASRLAGAEPWDGLEAATFGFRLGERGNYKFFRFSKPMERKRSR